MKTLPLDLREQILALSDARQGTHQDVADRYRVSLGMVKKLLQQRRRPGDLRPRHRFSGRKPVILEEHRSRMRQLLKKQPDMDAAGTAHGAGAYLHAAGYLLCLGWHGPDI